MNSSTTRTLFLSKKNEGRTTTGPRQLILRLYVALALMLPVAVSAQTYRVLKNFNGTDGHYLYAGLILASNTLYGTTQTGGSYGYGVVFKINTDGSGFSILKSFDSQYGGCPWGGLVLAGNTLYGVTSIADLGVLGTVFKLNTDGSGYAILASFNGFDSVESVILGGQTLYGTTARGGATNDGTVFKVNTDGSGYAVLKSFTGSDGANPQAGLVLGGGALYGTTTYGTASIFKINTNGSGFTVLKTFSGNEGRFPRGDMILAGETLYGTMEAGGNSDDGVVFKVNTNGSGYTVLKNFTGEDGRNLLAGLVLVGSTLYGTAADGGNFGAGVIFSLSTNGSDYAVLKHFRTTDGAHPMCQLAFGGGTLYGTTRTGGLSDYGVVFSLQLTPSGPPEIVNQPENQTIPAGDSASFTVNAAGSPPLAYQWFFGARAISGASGSDLQLTNIQFAQAGLYRVVVTNGFGAATSAPALLTVFGRPAYTVLHLFDGSDGRYPSGPLALSEGTLYGTTVIGGVDNHGTVFKVGTNGSGFSVLKYFSTENEQAPWGGVIASGGRLYGGTWGGGTPATCGAVFSLNFDGSAYSVLHSFSGGDGRAPTGGLLASGTTLFGTTYQGGAADYGTLFRINTDGSAFTVLKSFTGNDGGYLQAYLVRSGTILYGAAANRGSAGAGVIFRINSDGSGYTVLKDFSGADGSWPSGSMVLSGTTLYGTTRYGGTGLGSIFAIDVDGTDFRVLKTFTTADAGADPCGGLVLVGTGLYGTLAQGGDSVFGAVYRINTDGGHYLVIKRFRGGSDGAYPYSGLIFSGTTLYGAAQQGGISDCGVVFALCLPVPVLVTPPVSQTAELGSTVLLRVGTAPDPSLTYQWFFNGTNAITAATNNSMLRLVGVGLSQAGAYSVVVSNDFGALTSAPAMLSVIAPVPRRTVPALNLMGQAESFLNLDFKTTFDSTASWETFDTVALTNAPQWYFDLSAPLAPQRFYRAGQTNVLSPPSVLDLHMVPAITLTGPIGSSIRVDYINQFGPVDAWVTLGTVTLTSSPQLYFDTSSIGQPPRLWRIVPVP